jgi:cell wall assembly regulator SMI1
MNPIVELLKRSQGALFVNEDGIEDHFELKPPLTEQELATFEASLPCPLPEDVREVLRFARGFDGVLGGISFSGLPGGFELEEILPHAVTLAADGFGNFWVVDLTHESRSWEPIFYACHDAPVVVFQTDSLLHFLQEVIRFGNKPWKSEIDDVHESLSDRVWRENSGVLSFAQCVDSEDRDLKAFAASLDETWQLIDLRSPNLGDGFSWGRYGPKTVNRRFEEKRIFAYQKKSAGRRFLDALW